MSLLPLALKYGDGGAGHINMAVSLIPADMQISAEQVHGNLTVSLPGYDGGDSSGYSQSFGNAPAPAANSYAAPASAPTSDFSMIEDDDSQLPF